MSVEPHKYSTNLCVCVCVCVRVCFGGGGRDRDWWGEDRKNQFRLFPHLRFSQLLPSFHPVLCFTTSFIFLSKPFSFLLFYRSSSPFLFSLLLTYSFLIAVPFVSTTSSNHLLFFFCPSLPLIISVIFSSLSSPPLYSPPSPLSSSPPPSFHQNLIFHFSFWGHIFSSSFFSSCSTSLCPPTLLSTLPSFLFSLSYRLLYVSHTNTHGCGWQTEVQTCSFFQWPYLYAHQGRSNPW